MGNDSVFIWRKMFLIRRVWNVWIYWEEAWHNKKIKFLTVEKQSTEKKTAGETVPLL